MYVYGDSGLNCHLLGGWSGGAKQTGTCRRRGRPGRYWTTRHHRRHEGRIWPPLRPSGHIRVRDRLRRFDLWDGSGSRSRKTFRRPLTSGWFMNDTPCRTSLNRGTIVYRGWRRRCGWGWHGFLRLRSPIGRILPSGAMLGFDSHQFSYFKL